MAVALGAGMILGPMVASVMAQTVPTITSTTTTTERSTTTTRRTTTTSGATTTGPAPTTRPAPTTTEGTPTTPTTASTTSTTAAGGVTTSSVGGSTTTTTIPEGAIDPITNRQVVPTTTVPVGLDVGNPARISPIFPWLSVLGFLAAIGILGAQYFLTGRRS